MGKRFLSVDCVPVSRHSTKGANHGIAPMGIIGFAFGNFSVDYRPIFLNDGKGKCEIDCVTGLNKTK